MNNCVLQKLVIVAAWALCAKRRLRDNGRDSGR